MQSLCLASYNLISLYAQLPGMQSKQHHDCFEQHKRCVHWTGRQVLYLSNTCACLQAHADYEQRLQEEVNARLVKEQELMQLVSAGCYACCFT